MHRYGTLMHRSTPIGEECWGDWADAVDVPVRGQHRRVHVAHPHATRHNTADAVRKAYIVQYAPTARSAEFGDPNAGPPTRSELCADDRRRYLVVRDGERVPPPPLA